MYQQLYEHLEPHLHPLQFGARKNRSCVQTTLVMEGMVDFFRKNNPQQSVFLGLLDIKNAFTSVPIHFLMRVMQKRGVPIEWLSMIFEASYNVNNSFYNPITKEYEKDKAYSGVKQGCPLSPLFFSISIDPILSAVPGLQDHIICYIDDIAVIHPTKEGMTSAIKEIGVYLARLGLLLNPLKSKVMGYVHSYVDELGNLVDPEITPKIDPAGNNYFDKEGMPKGHASTVPLYIP